MKTPLEKVDPDFLPDKHPHSLKLSEQTFLVARRYGATRLAAEHLCEDPCGVRVNRLLATTAGKSCCLGWGNGRWHQSGSMVRLLWSEFRQEGRQQGVAIFAKDLVSVHLEEK